MMHDSDGGEARALPEIMMIWTAAAGNYSRAPVSAASLRRCMTRTAAMHDSEGGEVTVIVTVS